MHFAHERIDDNPPAGRLAFCLTHDLTGNGRPDVIVGGLGDTKPVDALGKEIHLRHVPLIGHAIRRLETNLFWYENPGWERHDVATVPDLSVGGTLADITGDGRVDLVAGQNLASDLYWFEQPDDPREEWTKHLITDDFVKYHDTAVADIDDDGEPEVIALSQRSETVFYYDIPDDPRRSPWPVDNRHIIAEDIHVEGVAVVDIDGDGRTELIAGPNVFHREDGGWRREEIAPGWAWTRIAVADLDGDGDLEIVLTEGDLPYQEDVPGRLGWFDPPDWEETVLADDLYCPHSLQIADFDGNGHPDIYVGEMSLGGNPEPTQYVFHNRGDATFDVEPIANGVPTHEAKLVDLTGDGALDIVGKSYTPAHHVDAWYQSA